MFRCRQKTNDNILRRNITVKAFPFQGNALFSCLAFIYIFHFRVVSFLLSLASLSMLSAVSFLLVTQKYASSKASCENVKLQPLTKTCILFYNICSDNFMNSLIHSLLMVVIYIASPLATGNDFWFFSGNL